MLKQSCGCCKIVGIIAIIGALNWGLVGVFGYNLVEALFGPASIVTRAIYILVGLSGLALLGSFFMNCPKCKKPQA